MSQRKLSFFSIILSSLSIFTFNFCQQKDYQQKLNTHTNSKNLLSLVTPIFGLQQLISAYTQEFKAEYEFFGHENMLNCVIYSKCGKYLIFVGWDSIIKIWDILQKKIKKTIKIDDMPHSISYCPKEANIASGNFHSDNNVSIWKIDIKSLDLYSLEKFGAEHDEVGICYKKFNTYNDRCIYSVAYSPCGNFIVFCGDDSYIKIWDLNLNKIVNSINVKDIVNDTLKKIDLTREWGKDVHYIVSAVNYSKNGQSLAFAAVKNFCDHVFSDQPVLSPHPKNDYSLRILDLNSEKCISQFIGHKDRITSIVFNNINQIASSSYDKTVRIWDLKTEECLQILKEKECITSVAFSPCDNFLVASVFQMIKIWKNYAHEVLSAPINEIKDKEDLD